MAPSPPPGGKGQLRWSDLTPRQQAAVLRGRAAAERARAERRAAAPSGERAAKPRAAKPGAAKPSAAKPQATQPGTGQPRTAQPRAGKPRSAQPDAGKPRTAQPRTAQPRTTQPGTAQSRQARSPRARTPQPARRGPPPARGGGGRRPPPPPARRRGILWRWRRGLFVVGLAAFALVAAGLYALSRVTLPTPPPLTQTSFVYGSNGSVLTRYTVENRVSVPLSAVPQVLINAVVSTEDRHYFTEGAVNPVSIIRAFISDLRGTGSLQGGSTITQQYVKQAYLTPQRTLTRKIKEAAIAVKLGHRDSKDTILDDYLNTIYFGRGAYGVEAASEAYFGKPVQQDGLAEASLLAGLIREPDEADPAVDATLARQNQSDTLAAMLRDKKISQGQAAQVRAEPMSRYVLSPSTAASKGSAGVAGDAYFLAAVRQELLARFPASEVDGGGLRVYTTLDPTLQTEAYNAVYGSDPDALDPSKGGPAGALVSVDDHGDVKAMVGGQGYASTYPGAQVNLALGTTGGGSGRQAGSTFKAFMLAYLIKSGYSIYSTFPAPPEVVVPHGNQNGSPWSVTNFEHEAGSAETTILDATAQSINTVYAQVVERLGPSNLTAMAEAMGISPSEIPASYPSEVLGTPSVSPLEMAAAYATFANRGVYTSPVLISRVTTANGTPLPWPAQTTRQVLTPEEAAVETYVLQHVVLDGTGGAAGNLGTPVAGKTGTTENSANAWFVGYTPNLTTAVWMGYTAANTPMVDYTHDGAYYASVQGGGVPAQLWHAYMATALASDPALGGQFPIVYYFGGQTLTPPDPSTLEFPEGMGTTTTTTPPTTIPTSTTSTTMPATSTTQPTSPTTVAHSPPTTPAPPPTTGPATVPPTTAHTTPTSAVPAG